jgi:hypothetical protein
VLDTDVARHVRPQSDLACIFCVHTNVVRMCWIEAAHAKSTVE